MKMKTMKSGMKKMKNNENLTDVSNHCTQYHSFEANDELPQKQCVMRKCSECGVNKYKEIISDKNTKFAQVKRYYQVETMGANNI